MLARSLLLTPLLLVFPTRDSHQAGSLPEWSSNVPKSGAKRPAAEHTQPRPATEDMAALRSSDWMQQVEREIERAESFWSRTPDGVHSASNHAQNLSSRIGPDGLEVFPLETTQGAASVQSTLALRTVSFGSENGSRSLGVPRVASVENRIDLHYAALSEWFVNDERGIEQGWTIPAPPPSCTGAILRIEVEVSGLHAEIAGDGLSALFVDDAAKTRLRYQGLRAWDATGRDLPACLFSTSSGFEVRCEDGDALYPITVDPVLSGPAWTAESDQASAEFGLSVCGAGDVNGDGFDDVIVGAPFFDNGQENEGRAFLYLGSAGGPSLAPDWTAESDQVDAYFGNSVSGAGDVNGDGFDDVIVGAHLFGNGQHQEGRAFLYLGQAGGPSLVPDWTAESDHPAADFGISVSGAGDVNGDGFDDVIVGAHLFGNGQLQEGRAYLYLGSASGPSLVANWTAESDQVGAKFGMSVSGAGDVNGDGFDDVIVGAPFLSNGQTIEGRAFFYLGSAGGPSLTADWTAESDQYGANFGTSVSGTGDVNGDGFDDVIVGAPFFSNGQLGEGRAFFYLGSASGPSLTADWTAESNRYSAQFGTSVSAAGDVNGDGFGDVIVGASHFHHGQPEEGRAFLYVGSAAGPSLVPDWTAEGKQSYAHFGRSVSGAGDVNGDGVDDVIVGAPSFNHGQTDEGRAYLYLGCGRIGTKYCTATPNSSGAPADISACCSASAALGDLTLDAAPVPDQFGVFLHGRNQTQLSFGNGFLCVTDAIVRGAVIHASGNLATYTYDNSDNEHSLAAFVGTTRNFQYWFRDPMGGGAFFNTSNAVSIAILP
jgi:hypothetical protein